MGVTPGLQPTWLQFPEWLRCSLAVHLWPPWAAMCGLVHMPWHKVRVQAVLRQVVSLLCVLGSEEGLGATKIEKLLMTQTVWFLRA
jgi:hypothetical protein